MGTYVVYCAVRKYSTVLWYSFLYLYYKLFWDHSTQTLEKLQYCTVRSSTSTVDYKYCRLLLCTIMHNKLLREHTKKNSLCAAVQVPSTHTMHYLESWLWCLLVVFFRQHPEKQRYRCCRLSIFFGRHSRYIVVRFWLSTADPDSSHAVAATIFCAGPCHRRGARLL